MPNAKANYRKNEISATIIKSIGNTTITQDRYFGIWDVHPGEITPRTAFLERVDFLAQYLQFIE